MPFVTSTGACVCVLAGPYTFLEVGACRIGNCTEKNEYLGAHVVKKISILTSISH